MHGRLLGHEQLRDRLLALARAGTLPHSHVLHGPEGVGKRTLALHVACALERVDPEHVNALLDTIVCAPESGGSIGIDQIRDVQRALSQQPQRSPYRIGIIDNADQLTLEAQNALLKTAEEPSPHAILILIARDSSQLLPTLQSRLHAAYVGPVPHNNLVAWLQQEHGMDEAQAQTCATEAVGAPGIAVRLHTDAAYQELRATARQLLDTTPAARREQIKALVAAEQPILVVLDAIIAELAYTIRDTQAYGRWHRCLELREAAVRGSLNMRLQLEALLID